MDLSKLRKPDLVMLCEEMGIEVAALRRKPHLIQALEDSGADEEELSECWELIQERMKRESEDKERETVRRKEEAEIQIREIERLRLQLQIVEAKCASETDADDYKIKTALLKKFRLSAEAFRRRFRDAQKKTGETFQEFAFNMKADLVEWLKGEGRRTTEHEGPLAALQDETKNCSRLPSAPKKRSSSTNETQRPRSCPTTGRRRNSREHFERS
ncbi:hypothetical protein HPB50_027761 [Hyalomma asiaticum]|nr:hypothetical protein HPB50_027761 [Hyalomma asiaticum]